jgi:hypothetical protein
LRSSDGLLILEPQGNGTLFTAFDFFNADWGIAKSVAGDRIWMDCIRGTVESDLAIKLRAERAEASYSEIRKQASELAKPYIPADLKSQPFIEQWDFR